MNILDFSKDQIEEMVKLGLMRKETIKHYDLCRAMASGMTQEKATEKFNYTDDRYVRRIKSKKCPECNK